MAHVRIDYGPPERVAGLDVFVVRVLAGPAPRNIRPVGHLRLHAPELNAIDRLLARGAQFEEPANTYALERVALAIDPDVDAAMQEHVERRLAEARS